MNFDIASLVVNAGASDGWGKVLCCGLLAAIVGGAISGFITRWAVISTNKENREMWQKDSFQKYKNETIIKSITALAGCLYYIEIHKLDSNENAEIIWDEMFKKEYFLNCYDCLSIIGIFCEKSNPDFFEKLKNVLMKLEIIIKAFKEIDERMEIYIQDNPNNPITYNKDDIINQIYKDKYKLKIFSFVLNACDRLDFNTLLMAKLKNEMDQIHRLLVDECQL